MVGSESSAVSANQRVPRKLSEASRFVVMFLCGPPKRRPMVQCQRNSILDRLHGSVILDNVQKDENGQKKRNRSPVSQRPSEQ